MFNCRICGGTLEKIINFGKIALVGNFEKKLKKSKKFKISLNFCRVCKHVQISEIIKPNLLFKNYLWETGVSKSNIFLIKDLIKKNLPISGFRAAPPETKNFNLPPNRLEIFLRMRESNNLSNK